MDLQRLFVFVGTGGRDGRSPYVTADLLSTLRERGCIATLKKVEYRPYHAVMTIDDKEVHLRHALDEDVPQQCWVHVTCGNKFVRVNALRRADMVVLQDDDHQVVDLPAKVFDNWIQNWPHRRDVGATVEDTTRAFARRLTGGDSFQVLESRVHSYLSETALADAVQLVLLDPATLRE
jgi:hypothetical protein